MLWSILYSMEGRRPHVNMSADILSVPIRGRRRSDIRKREIRRVNQRGPDRLGTLLIENIRPGSEALKPPD